MTSKLKKKVPRDFLLKKLKKKIRSRQHKPSENRLLHVYTHTHTQTVFKNWVFSFLGSENVLIMPKNQKLKLHLSQWFLYEEPKLLSSKLQFSKTKEQKKKKLYFLVIIKVYRVKISSHCTGKNLPFHQLHKFQQKKFFFSIKQLKNRLVHKLEGFLKIFKNVMMCECVL